MNVYLNAELLFVQPTEFEEKAVKKVDDLLESYMGIRDTELGECCGGFFCSEPDLYQIIRGRIA